MEKLIHRVRKLLWMLPPETVAAMVLAEGWHSIEEIYLAIKAAQILDADKL